MNLSHIINPFGIVPSASKTIETILVLTLLSFVSSLPDLVIYRFSLCLTLVSHGTALSTICQAVIFLTRPGQNSGTFPETSQSSGLD